MAEFLWGAWARKPHPHQNLGGNEKLSPGSLPGETGGERERPQVPLRVLPSPRSSPVPWGSRASAPVPVWPTWIRTRVIWLSRCALSSGPEAHTLSSLNLKHLDPLFWLLSWYIPRLVSFLRINVKFTQLDKDPWRWRPIPSAVFCICYTHARTMACLHLETL